LAWSASSTLGLEIVGGGGVIGLGLFKVSRRHGLEFEVAAPAEEPEADVRLEFSRLWPAELKDDL